MFDSYVAMKKICKSAKKEIIIIDDYAGKELLNLLKDIDKHIILVSSKIDETDYQKYNEQYNNVIIKYSDQFHDRFIIIDKKDVYHSGASFKDLGKKCFAITQIEEKDLINKLLETINIELSKY